eukprot:c32124_g1_i1.p1 GENE.c32124_g1_i1~~c32124_g1_i1.p1  ORF type:complete len:180 (+),score=31.27 c32124_g1_i1:38-541(+)
MSEEKTVILQGYGGTVNVFNEREVYGTWDAQTLFRQAAVPNVTDRWVSFQHLESGLYLTVEVYGPGVPSDLEEVLYSNPLTDDLLATIPKLDSDEFHDTPAVLSEGNQEQGPRFTQVFRIVSSSESSDVGLQTSWGSYLRVPGWTDRNAVMQSPHCMGDEKFMILDA